MALIFFTGGESGTPDFTSYSTSVSCRTSPKKSGAYGIYLSGPSLTQVFPAQTEFFFSCAIFMESYSSINAIVDFRDASSSVISLRGFSSSSPWQLFVGGSSVATGVALIGLNVWHIIEVHIKIHGSTGLFHFRVDGLDDAIFTGNTAVVASNVTRFSAGISGSGYNLDDIILNDITGTINNSWMGGAKIVALRPIGPGNQTQWTPSAGLNWQCVDEVPISITDYVSGNIVGMLDLYDLAGLPAGICSDATMLGVKVFNSAARSGITVSYIENSLRTNDSTVFSSVITATSVPIVQSTIWDLNPVTGTTWTYTDINALEAGVKVA